MTKKEKIVADTLKMIKEQLGLDLKLAPNCKGLKTKFGKKYFNVALESPLFCSKQFELLAQFSAQYGLIDVAPGGNMVATIFVK